MYFTADNPHDAQQICNELTSILISENINTRTEVAADMERQQRGEQMRLLNSANLPDDPTFLVRWMFAAGALGTGLMFKIGCAL